MCLQDNYKKVKKYDIISRAREEVNLRELTEQEIVRREKLEEIKRLNLEHYPICVAKTQYSISDDETKLGYPKDYTLNVRDIVIQTGSEMIIVLLNKIITMPGLPKHPNFENME